MALYEIVTLKARGRVSLISYGDFSNDPAAILFALTLKRKGETVEVWRGAIPVYRMGLAVEARRPRMQSGEVRHPWSQRLLDLSKIVIKPISSSALVVFRTSDISFKMPVSKPPPKSPLSLWIKS